MKGITLCADCAYYNMRTHKCKRGATGEPDLSKGDDVRFFTDCPLTDVKPVRHGRWIPIEDDLPENRVVVIFTINRGKPMIGCGYRIHSERCGLLLTRWFDKLSGLNFSDYDVTAWMPMPEAYKEDNDDDT